MQLAAAIRVKTSESATPFLPTKGIFCACEQEVMHCTPKSGCLPCQQLLRGAAAADYLTVAGREC